MYTTKDVADKAEITMRTLARWIEDEKIAAPAVLGRQRVWTEQELKEVVAYRKKNYWEGRGPKPGSRRKK